MEKGEKATRDRRHYLRIRTVFPVVFSLFPDTPKVPQPSSTSNISSPQKKQHQGFTRNISKDGLCLEVDVLDESLLKKGILKHSKLQIEVDVPYQKQAFSSEAEIVWIEDHPSKLGLRYFLGIKYPDIQEKKYQTLFRFAKAHRRQPFLWILFFFLLLIIIGILYKENHQSKTQLESLQWEQDSMKSRLVALNRTTALQKKHLRRVESKQKKWEEKEKETASDALYEKWQMEGELKTIFEEKKKLSQNIDKLTQDKINLLKELKTLKTLDEWIVYQVLLKNGTTLTGEKILMTPSSLELKIANGTLSLNRKNIETINELALKSKIELSKRWAAEERLAEGRINDLWKLATNPLPTTPLFPLPGLPLITLKNKRIYLDGKLFFIKGVAYGIEYPKLPPGMKSFKKIPLSVFRKDFEMIKKAGFNVIRTYEPLNLELLNLALQYDLKVIENITYPSGVTDFSSKVHLNYHIQQALDVIKRHKNHEAILMWSLWNDLPWVWGLLGNPVPQQGSQTIHDFLEQIYKAVKSSDPHHPITASNVLGYEGSELGFDFLDILGFNAYIGGTDWYLQEEADQTMKELILIQNQYKKPVVILETGFSTFISDLDPKTVLQAQVKTVGESLAGLTIFQWADGWNKAGYYDRQDFHIEEHWGLVSGYRKPKEGLKTISELFNSISSDSKGWKPLSNTKKTIRTKKQALKTVQSTTTVTKNKLS